MACPLFNSGTWTEQEDATLMLMVKTYNENWEMISKGVGTRSEIQCRTRYKYRLYSAFTGRRWTATEDGIVMRGYAKLGNNWDAISKLLENRPATTVKNRWYTKLSKLPFMFHSARTSGSVTAPDIFDPVFYAFVDPAGSLHFLANGQVVN